MIYLKSCLKQKIVPHSGYILVLSAVLLLASFLDPAGVSAQSDFWGPRLEFGGSIGYVTASQLPVWSSNNFRTGSIHGSYRIIRRLSLQAGYEGSLEEKINVKALAYGSDLVLKQVDGSYYGAPWVGVRYEMPSNVLKGYRFGSHSLNASIGYAWARFGVSTNVWTFKGIPETDTPRRKYQVADVGGPFGSIAVRWRLNADFSNNAESWIGAHGFDVGLKYTRFTSCSTRYDTIEESGSEFSFLQVFVIGFIKLGF